MTYSLRTDAFLNGRRIPREFTCDGANVSPGLSWGNAPEGTRSFALIVDDPDAPGKVWNHWVLYDIPASVTALPEHFEPGDLGVSGVNSFGDSGYGGPCPPPGHGIHHYHFRLYALGVASLGLRAGADRARLEAALQDNVISTAEYVGTYER